MKILISKNCLILAFLGHFFSCQTPAYCNSEEIQATEAFQVRESREINIKLSDDTHFIVTRSMGGLVRVEMRVRHSYEVLNARVSQYMDEAIAREFFRMLRDEIPYESERFKIWRYSFQMFELPLTTASFEAPDSTGHLQLIMGLFGLFRSLLISPIFVCGETEGKLLEKLEQTLNPLEFLGNEKLQAAVK